MSDAVGKRCFLSYSVYLVIQATKNDSVNQSMK